MHTVDRMRTADIPVGGSMVEMPTAMFESDIRETAGKLMSAAQKIEEAAATLDDVIKSGKMIDVYVNM